MTLEECITVALEVVQRLRAAQLLDEHERVSVAHTAAWEASEVPTCTPGLVNTITSRRIVDTVREKLGRRGHRDFHTVQLKEWEPLGADDAYEVEFEDLVRRAAHGDERTEAILRAVAAGETLLSIGERHGITEGRVCQIVKRTQRYVGR